MKDEIKAYLSKIGRKGGLVKSKRKRQACIANSRKPRKKRKHNGKQMDKRKSLRYLQETVADREFWEILEKKAAEEGL